MLLSCRKSLSETLQRKAAMAMAQTTQITQNNFSNFTLLVVDDEDILRRMIAYQFEKMGFKVLVAESGDAAFDIIKKNNVDLVVSDMRMPCGDGLSLLENIRLYNPVKPQLIFVTGYYDVSVAECMARGAAKVLYKPYDRTMLMNTVLGVLGT
jgi:CheY-like chemotaxis protein